MLQASTGTSSPRPHKSQSVCFFLIAFIANLTLFAYICNVMNKLSRLKYFMTFGIWNREEHENGWCKRTGLNVVRKMYMAIRLFIERGHVDYATQLSFSTILAIVPIFAMIFAIGRGFGLSKYIETANRRPPSQSSHWPTPTCSMHRQACLSASVCCSCSIVC